jgi:hypothetical protein
MEFELIEEGRDAFISHARKRAQEMVGRDPILGDVVHYWDGERCLVAMVTELNWGDSPTIVAIPVWLTIFPSRGRLPEATADAVQHDSYDHPRRGRNTWHWPVMGR